jgi:hypothetical protein
MHVLAAPGRGGKYKLRIDFSKTPSASKCGKVYSKKRPNMTGLCQSAGIRCQSCCRCFYFRLLYDPSSGTFRSGAEYFSSAQSGVVQLKLVATTKHERSEHSRAWDIAWNFQKLFVTVIHLRIGISLAEPTAMKFFCRHCDEMVVGKPYRVISQEDGEILLNMTVCRPCYEQARALGLDSVAMPFDSEPRTPGHSWVHGLP